MLKGPLLILVGQGRLLMALESGRFSLLFRANKAEYLEIRNVGQALSLVARERRHYTTLDSTTLGSSDQSQHYVRQRLRDMSELSDFP